MKLVALALVLVGLLLIAGFFVGSLQLPAKGHGHDSKVLVLSMVGLGAGAWIVVGGLYIFLRKIRDRH